MALTFSKHDDIPDVRIIWPKVIGDDRGWFSETYVEREFFNNELNIHIVQENHSKSKAGVFRGLHYQRWPYEQGKLVRVLKGRLIDYFMDIRKSSPTFGLISNYTLTAGGPMLWIPRGFAHGVYILEDDTELLYKVDNVYAPLHECGIKATSVINGLPTNIQFSEKDRQWPIFDNAVYFL